MMKSFLNWTLCAKNVGLAFYLLIYAGIPSKDREQANRYYEFVSIT
jgi:hypothetical protein